MSKFIREDPIDENLVPAREGVNKPLEGMTFVSTEEFCKSWIGVTKLAFSNVSTIKLLDARQKDFIAFHDYGYLHIIRDIASLVPHGAPVKIVTWKAALIFYLRITFLGEPLTPATEHRLREDANAAKLFYVGSSVKDGQCSVWLMLPLCKQKDSSSHKQPKAAQADVIPMQRPRGKRYRVNVLFRDCPRIDS